MKSAWPSRPERTARSTVSAYTKVATNNASVRCTNLSRAKVRNSRGENCPLVNCRVTRVSEKVSEVTVIIDPAIVLRTPRAAAAPPPNRSSVAGVGNRFSK